MNTAWSHERETGDDGWQSPAARPDPVLDALARIEEALAEVEHDPASRSFRRLENRRSSLWLPTISQRTQ